MINSILKINLTCLRYINAFLLLSNSLVSKMYPGVLTMVLVNKIMFITSWLLSRYNLSRACLQRYAGTIAHFSHLCSVSIIPLARFLQPTLIKSSPVSWKEPLYCIAHFKPANCIAIYIWFAVSLRTSCLWNVHIK